MILFIHYRFNLNLENKYALKNARNVPNIYAIGSKNLAIKREQFSTKVTKQIFYLSNAFTFIAIGIKMKTCFVAAVLTAFLFLLFDTVEQSSAQQTLVPLPGSISAESASNESPRPPKLGTPLLKALVCNCRY